MNHFCIKVWLKSSMKWVHWSWPEGSALILQLLCWVLIPWASPNDISPLCPTAIPAPSHGSCCTPFPRSCSLTLRLFWRSSLWVVSGHLTQNSLTPKNNFLGFRLINPVISTICWKKLYLGNCCLCTLENSEQTVTETSILVDEI